MLPERERVKFALEWMEGMMKGRQGSSILVLIVTTRDSVSSNRNAVELQNKCLALGHSNLFIPSTLYGSCLDSKTGKIDDNKVKENLNDAIDIYISRVNKSPCANTKIHLYKETDSSCYQTLRAFVKVFLKGNPAEKPS